MFVARRKRRPGWRIDLRWAIAAVALFTGTAVPDDPDRGAGQGRTPAVVVAELFTSEGCSSCPPADAVLSDLVRNQPVPGVEVIALSEHVDYWDRLGWADPFANTEFSSRQAAYDERVFGAGRIYTPQLVVDGQHEAIGGDADAVRQAILRAAGPPKTAVAVTAVADRPARDRARIDVRVDVPPALAAGAADVLVAIVEDNLVTEVRRGENGGRTLRHDAVVRVLRAIGALPPGERAWSTTASVPVGRDWRRDQLRAVAFLQVRDTRRIVGAAAARVVPGASIH
jgi:hypothetical protein